MAVLMTLKGDKRLMRNLQKIQREARDLRSFFKDVGVYMLSSINKTFQSEGNPSWGDIKDSTKKARERKNKWPGKILQVIGTLKDSIVPEVSRTDLKVGTSVPYAKHLHFGTEYMPDRVFLQFLNEDVKTIHRIFESHLKKTMFGLG